MSNESEQQINSTLLEFSSNSVAFMNKLPHKSIVQTGASPLALPFSLAAIKEQAYIDARDQQRLRTLQPSIDTSGTRAPIASNDKAENLVDSLAHNTLLAMETAGLKQASLVESPWSDDYWAIYKGILGARYGDPSFPNNSDWKVNYDYIRANPVSSILSSGSASRINRLSPSEKYDALIGDSSESLTRALWAEGKKFYDTYGDVESWMGICHGWSPAAYMLSRPTKSIVLKTPNNVPVTFYPSDIKALASLLWANAASSTRFIGGRCNDKTPATDSATGRSISSQCFDTNPATWHLAIVNQIGVNKRSMVLDATFDYQVWNQPAFSYSYSYFNPQTRQAKRTLAEATIRLADFSNDKFKRFRSAQAASFVGIQMSVSYVVETRPTQRDTDSMANDAIHRVDYYYDLELDAAGKIIGGEWYQNPHPDFLWTPAKTQRAQTQYEAQATGSWVQNSTMPETWRNAAKLAATNQRAPLAAIVEQLIKFSNNASVPTPSTPTPSTPPNTPSPTVPTQPSTPTPSTPPSTSVPTTPTPTAPTQPNNTSTPTNTASTGSWLSRLWRRWFS